MAPPDVPSPDPCDRNPRVPPHGAVIPSLTVLPRDHHYYNTAQAVKEALRVLYGKFSFRPCRNYGLFYFGPDESNVCSGIERTLLMVLELKEDEINRWHEVDESCRIILREYDLDGPQGVCVRYYRPPPSAPPASPLAVTGTSQRTRTTRQRFRERWQNSTLVDVTPIATAAPSSTHATWSLVPARRPVPTSNTTSSHSETSTGTEPPFSPRSYMPLSPTYTPVSPTLSNSASATNRTYTPTLIPQTIPTMANPTRAVDHLRDIAMLSGADSGAVSSMYDSPGRLGQEGRPRRSSAEAMDIALHSGADEMQDSERFARFADCLPLPAAAYR